MKTEGRATRLSWAEGVLVLNLYGNLLLLTAAASFAGLYLWPSPVTGGLALCGVGLAVWGIAVTRRIRSKLRLSNAILRRVHRQGYDPKFFRLTGRDYCMRLLTRYLHLRLGRLGEAERVIRMHQGTTGLLIQPGGPVLSTLVENGQISEADLEAAVRAVIESRCPVEAADPAMP